jgi:hypothetical protein
MSPMLADPQFQTAILHPSNLDRCNLCGAPRSAHGADWTCPSAVIPDRAPLAFFVVAAGVLAVLGGATWALASAASITLSSLAAFACLAGLTLLIGGVAVSGRRGPHWR